MTIQEKIKEVNRLLASYGDEAIQTREIGDEKFYGFKPQYIINAMNEVFTQFGWRHQVRRAETRTVVTKSGDERIVAIAEVSIQFLNEAGMAVYETGSQFGTGNVMSGNVGDGLKSAVTDAIGKSLSLLSVGEIAYRGKLGEKVGNQPEESKTIPTSEPLFPVVNKTTFTTAVVPPSSGNTSVSPSNGAVKKPTFAAPKRPSFAAPRFKDIINDTKKEN